MPNKGQSAKALCRLFFRRVQVAECYTRQTVFRVHLGAAYLFGPVVIILVFIKQLAKALARELYSVPCHSCLVYHEIGMEECDQHKTSFITQMVSWSVFEYKG